jgi:hypothetical protein
MVLPCFELLPLIEQIKKGFEELSPTQCCTGRKGIFSKRLSPYLIGYFWVKTRFLLYDTMVGWMSNTASGGVS